MEDNLDKKIEKAIRSIDSIEKATAPHFFFTRLEARMKREESIWEKVTSFIVQPAIAFSCICLVIMINAFVIFSSSNLKKTSSQQNSELATVDEYSQVSANFYELENIKP